VSTRDHGLHRETEYGRVISICTAAASASCHPGLLAILTPVIVGFGINYLAWAPSWPAPSDGAADGQHAVELRWAGTMQEVHRGRHEGGKGSDAHKAAVIGDTVGDPSRTRRSGSTR